MQGEAFDENVFDSVLDGLFRFGAHRVKRRGSGVHGEVVIAVNTRDFFDDIRFNRNVFGGAPARHGHREVVAVSFDGKTERFERVDNRVPVNFDTGIAVDISLIKIERYGAVMIGVFVGKRRNHAGIFVGIGQQFDKPRNSRNGHFRVEAFFIAHRRVGSVRQTHGGFADGNRVEGGGFQRQGGGVFDDFRVKTAHNPGDCHRRVAVANHQSIFVDMAFHTVERLELKRFLEALNPQFFHLARVKCVHRLPHFEHQIVGQVRKEVNRAHPAVVKADTHIHGTYRRVDVFHLQAGIALAKRVFDFHIHFRQCVVSVEINSVKRL